MNENAPEAIFLNNLCLRQKTGTEQISWNSFTYIQLAWLFENRIGTISKFIRVEYTTNLHTSTCRQKWNILEQ